MFNIKILLVLEIDISARWYFILGTSDVAYAHLGRPQYMLATAFVGRPPPSPLAPAFESTELPRYEEW